MRNVLLAAFFAASATGCIIYDEELVYEETGSNTGNEETDTRPDRPDANPDSPDSTDSGATTLSLSPSVGLSGEIVITSLSSDAGTLATITDVAFFGDADIIVLASSARDSELLLTLDIPVDAPASDNHLLVEFEDGGTAFIEDAFTVQ